MAKRKTRKKAPKRPRKTAVRGSKAAGGSDARGGRPGAKDAAEQLQTVIRAVTRLGGKLRTGVAFSDAERERITRLEAAAVGRSLVDFVRLSDGVVGAAFGVSRRTVLNWHSKRLPQNPDGTHALVDVLRWYIERGGDAAGRATHPALVKAELQQKEARTRLLELRFLHERGSLISLDAVKRVWSRHITEARLKLSGLVERVVVMVPPKSRTAVRTAVLKAIEDACRDLADGARASEGNPAERKRPKRRAKR